MDGKLVRTILPFHFLVSPLAFEFRFFSIRIVREEENDRVTAVHFRKGRIICAGLVCVCCVRFFITSQFSHLAAQRIREYVQSLHTKHFWPISNFSFHFPAPCPHVFCFCSTKLQNKIECVTDQLEWVFLIVFRIQMWMIQH